MVPTLAALPLRNPPRRVRKYVSQPPIFVGRTRSKINLGMPERAQATRHQYVQLRLLVAPNWYQQRQWHHRDRSKYSQLRIHLAGRNAYLPSKVLIGYCATAGIAVFIIVFHYFSSYEPCLDPFREKHTNPLLCVRPRPNPIDTIVLRRPRELIFKTFGITNRGQKNHARFEKSLVKVCYRNDHLDWSMFSNIQTKKKHTVHSFYEWYSNHYRHLYHC